LVRTYNMKNKKKHYKAIQENISLQEHYSLDIMNLILGTAVIVFSVLGALGIGGLLMFSLTFLSGSILMALNAYKNRERSRMLTGSFTVFAILLMCAFGYLIYLMTQAG